MLTEETVDFYKKNQSYYERNASKYEQSSWYYFNKYKSNQVTKEINKCIQLINKDTIRILEIGPGTGYLLSKIKQDQYKKITYLGVEHSKEMSAILNERLQNKFKELRIVNESVSYDFIQSNLKDMKFDLIMGSSILHHLPDYDMVVSGLFQLLDKNGVMYFVREPIAKADCEKGNIIKNIANKIYGGISNLLLKPAIRSVLWPKKVKQENPENIAIHMFTKGISLDPFKELLKTNELVFLRKYNRRASSFFSYVENKWLKFTRKDLFGNTLFAIAVRKKQ